MALGLYMELQATYVSEREGGRVERERACMYVWRPPSLPYLHLPLVLP